MLFNNTNYYLNDRMVRCFDNYINYAFRVVNEAEVQKDYLLIVDAGSASESGSAHGVRAVVILQSQVKLEKDKDGVWQII